MTTKPRRRKKPGAPKKRLQGSPPPPIPNHSGVDYMKMIDPVRDVSFDAGSFDYVWRLVEANLAKIKTRRDYYMESSPEYVDLVERTANEFRRAAQNMPGIYGKEE